MSQVPSLRVRRTVVLVVSVAVPLLLARGLGHRGVHMVRSMVLPGAGLFGANDLLAVAFLVGAVLATVAWVKWGADWLLVAVVVGAMVASALIPDTHSHLDHDHDHAIAVVQASHEFPLVVLVAGLVSWLRGVAGRLPGVSRLAGRRARRMDGLSSIERLRAVDRSRVAALLALADDERAAAVASDPAITARAARVGRWSRGRFGGDPLRVDHAHARAARSLAGTLDAAGAERFLADASRARLGVPCSEPTWLRPLDATLAAIAVERAGGSAERWVAALSAEFRLRRGHRAAFFWTPLGWHAGSAPAWEHAAFTALARAAGWLGDDDWAELRARALGASARGTGHPHDERLVAAARLWLTQVDDPQAATLLARRTVRHDPLAVALDDLATRLREDPLALRSTAARSTASPATVSTSATAGGNEPRGAIR